MSTPCVVYFEKWSHSFSESFSGRTSRGERICGRIRQEYMADHATAFLTIDGIVIDGFKGETYVEAHAWVVQQIEDLLGYHVVEMLR